MDKQYNHQAAEHDAQSKWHREKTYSLANNPGPLFSIDTPPPTVSGNLHIGHIFSYTQTDILARYARMNGKSVFYPFGFDDNGLPTERYVEKKLDISAHKMSRSEFIALCLKETHEVEHQFQKLWQRMGLSADWDNCYSTISDSTRKISQESFLRLLEKGFVYRKNEPALYCPTCRTSVAQAELDDAEKPSTFNNVVFKDEQGNNLIVGTTRPELLPAVNALLYNPTDSRYTHLAGTFATVPLFEHKVPILADDKVLLDKGTGLAMTSTFGDKTDIEWFKKHNLEYRPMLGLDGRMLPASGILVGLTVFSARVKVIEELQKAGLLVAQKAIMHSVNVHERCKKEIEYVMLPQWFLNLKDHKKKFIELGDQINWFPSYMKSRYVNWVENIGWDWCLSRQRFFGIPFPVWHCLSCQTVITPRYDQLPIDPQETAYSGHCPKCKSADIVPDKDVMDTWNTSSVTPYICMQLLYPELESVFELDMLRQAQHEREEERSVHDNNPASLSSATQKIKDENKEDNKSTSDPFVLSLSKHPQFLPMSMRPQAHDIIRTWAFYTIVKSWMHNNTIPWHTIVISGHVLADSKEKLSKSKDNASTSPQGLLERYPADVIRYWTSSGGLGQDIAFSEQQLKIGQRLVTKLWNAFRFIHEHISVIDQAQPTTPLGATNEWLLHTATQTFTRYQTYMEQNEFGLALDTIEKFFWNNFCDNYLELIKDQLFKPENYTEFEVKATRWTLYQVGLRILQWYAPYLPHITEHLYGTLYQKQISADHADLSTSLESERPAWPPKLAEPEGPDKRRLARSIHQLRYSAIQQGYEFKESAQHMEMLIEIIAQVRRLKTEKQLSLKVPLQKLTVIYSDEHILHQLQAHEQLLRGVSHAQEIAFTSKLANAEIGIHQLDENWIATIKLEV